MQILKLFFKFIHMIFNILITTIILLWLIYIESYVQNFKMFDSQIFLHFIVATILIIILWWSLFKKIKPYKILLISVFFFLSIFLPSVVNLLKFSGNYEDTNMNLSRINNVFNSDFCLEDGDCKAGRIIIINNKEILINKNSCIENNWDWYEKSQYCKIKNVKFHPKEIIYE